MFSIQGVLTYKSKLHFVLESANEKAIHNNHAFSIYSLGAIYFLVKTLLVQL